jgi:hypothetical protein
VFRPRALGALRAAPGLGTLDPPGGRCRDHRASGRALHLLAQLLESDGARLVGAAQVDPLPEDVDRDHLLGAAQGRDRLALARKALPRGDVELVLVLETAEQAPAPAGDLRRVE